MRSILQTKGLTGKFYFKSNFWGSLVLMVEEACEYLDTVDSNVSPEFTIWRKGSQRDVAELELT